MVLNPDGMFQDNQMHQYLEDDAKKHKLIERMDSNM